MIRTNSHAKIGPILRNQTFCKITMVDVYKLGLAGGVVLPIYVRRWTVCLRKTLKQSALMFNNR